MDIKYILLPIIILFITYIITYTIKDNYNNKISHFVDINFLPNVIETSQLCRDPSEVPSTDDIERKINMLQDYTKLTYDPSQCDNPEKIKRMEMIPYLYNYLDNLNTILVDEEKFIQDFSGNKYFPAYKKYMNSDSLQETDWNSVANQYPLDLNALSQGKYETPEVTTANSNTSNPCK